MCYLETNIVEQGGRERLKRSGNGEDWMMCHQSLGVGMKTKITRENACNA